MNFRSCCLLLSLAFLFAPFSSDSLSLDGVLPSSIDLPSLEALAAGAWGAFKSLLNAHVGVVHDAIVPLKKYFAQFGYLTLPSGQNVTDVFDNDTLAAVKLYQESFNLTVSGVLDLQTLLKIMTPRCGREDVVDGIPLMLQSGSGNSSAVAHLGRGLVARYSFFPSMPTWPSSRRNLTYAFNFNNETDRVTAEQRQQVFANAFSEWAAVIPINFTEISDFDNADIKIEFVYFSHGDGEPFDGVLGILAHSFAPSDGRFHLDDSEYWSVAASDGGPQDMDLQSVVTHEIGHLIGLAHTNVETAIMYPSISPRQVKVKLQQDDIEGAQTLYGANPDYNPNSPLPGIPSNLEDMNAAHSLPLASSLSSLVTSILMFTLLSLLS